MAQQLDETLDSRIPKTFVATKPVVGALERPWVDAAEVDASAHRTFHQPCPLESLYVLGRRRKRHAIWRSELADGELASGESLEHCPPRVITEGAEDEIEACCTFNHIIEYPMPLINCQPNG
jgi:hypothetical protein